MNIKKIIYYFIPVLAVILILAIAKKANIYDINQTILPAVNLIQPPAAPLKTDAVIFTSGCSNDIPVFTINDAFFISSSEIEIKKSAECALNFPAAILLPFADRSRTIFLSDNSKNIYLYDNFNKSITSKTINKLKETVMNTGSALPGASARELLTIKSMALNEKNNKLAVCYEKLNRIIIYDAVELREMFKIETENLLPADVFWNGDEIYFNLRPADNSLNAITLCACRPPYSKIEKIGEYSMPAPYAAANITAGAKVLKSIFYNEFTGTILLFDHKTSNFSIIPGNMPPASKNLRTGDNSKNNTAETIENSISSAILWIDDAKFAIIRGDIAKIFIFNGSKLENELTLDESYKKSKISAVPIEINKKAGCLISSTTCDKISLFDYSSQKIILQKSLGERVKISAINLR